MKQVKFRIVQTILPLLIGMFLSLGAYAQQITVKGHVKDAMGEPVIGANVIAKGTTTGTITDFDGNFTLNVPQNSILSITFVGYKVQSPNQKIPDRKTKCVIETHLNIKQNVIFGAK